MKRNKKVEIAGRVETQEYLGEDGVKYIIKVDKKTDAKGRIKRGGKVEVTIGSREIELMRGLSSVQMSRKGIAQILGIDPRVFMNFCDKNPEIESLLVKGKKYSYIPSG